MDEIFRSYARAEATQESPWKGSLALLLAQAAPSHEHVCSVALAYQIMEPARRVHLWVGEGYGTHRLEHISPRSESHQFVLYARIPTVPLLTNTACLATPPPPISDHGHGSPSLSVKAISAVTVHASTSAPQAGARRLGWLGSIQFTKSEGDPILSSPPTRQHPVVLRVHEGSPPWSV